METYYEWSCNHVTEEQSGSTDRYDEEHYSQQTYRMTSGTTCFFYEHAEPVSGYIELFNKLLS